jgi:hypothetical protein
LSPSGSDALPVVVPSGAASLGCCPRCIGAQLAAGGGDGGAVWAGGVTGPGGACAEAPPQAAITIHDRKIARFIPMQGKRLTAADVPCRIVRLVLARLNANRRPLRSKTLFRPCGTGSAKNAPSAASAAARSG